MALSVAEPRPQVAVAGGSGRLQLARWAAAALVVALAARLAYGPAHTGYDAWFALVWGQDLASGTLPDLDLRIAPTPHPLLNLVAAPLSLLGATRAPAALSGLHFLSYGVMMVAVFAAGRSLAGPICGLLAAAVLATRPLIVAELLFVSVDLPFLALVTTALALLLSSRGAPRSVGVLLVAAGLLRPEGWLLAIAYALWMARSGERRAVVFAVAAGAPLLWACTDLLSTGDPLWSLHQTRALADQLGRPQSIETAWLRLPSLIGRAAGQGVAVLGAVGAVAMLATLRDRRLVPAAIAVLGAAGFLVLGGAGLPLLLRYTLLPSVGLLLAAAWLVVTLTGGAWRWSRPIGAALAVLLTVAVAGQLSRDLARIDRVIAGGALQLRVERGLTDALDDPRVAGLIARCGTPTVPHYRPVPQVAFQLGVSPALVLVSDGGSSPLLLDPLPTRAAAAYRLTPIDQEAFTADRTSDTRIVMANDAWVVRERCTAP